MMMMMMMNVVNKCVGWEEEIDLDVYIHAYTKMV